MRLFVFIAVGIGLLAAQHALCKIRKPASTVASFERDYSDVYGPLEPDDSLIVQKTHLSADPMQTFYIVASKLSCGAHGCENAIYQIVGDHSFLRIAVISGSITPLDEFVHGFKKLQVTEQDPTYRTGPQTQQTWIFEYTAGGYVRIPKQDADK